MAREHEFSFLDHALKAGDSLVGLTLHEIQAANWDASKPGLPLFRQAIKERVDAALEGREAIRNASDDILSEAQAARYSRVQDSSEIARVVGDAVVAAFFSADKAKARETERAKVESWITGELQPKWDLLTAKAHAFRADHGWQPFHWEIEFPEVFRRENPGFDAIVGNPPFAGKNTISAASGPRYLPWLQHLHEGAHGNADLVAHFFRRAFNLLRDGGAFGLIATNTIGQGDTRHTGLAYILRSGGSIFNAVKRYHWPNEGAAVVVSIVHVAKGGKKRSPVIDGRLVNRISAYLVAGNFDEAPATLEENADKAFQGSILLGMGFTFDDAAAAKGEAESLKAMHTLIENNAHNAERIKPYIGGEEINNSPTHAHHRYAIDFEDFPLARIATYRSWFEWTDERVRRGLREGRVPGDYPDPVAADWPDLLQIVETRVKPARARQGDQGGRNIWWRYLRPRPELQRAIAGFDRVLATNCGATPHLAMAFLAGPVIYANTLAVFAYSGFAPFAVLQSRVHEVWVRFFSSSMKDDLRYAPSDCFETFPFPPDYETDANFEAVGKAYHDHRAKLMIAAEEGMTKTYNRFHKESERGVAIQTLRELHDAMDRAVLSAYGWDDLAETLCPQFLTLETENDHTYQGRYFWPSEQRDVVLARLLALNAERHAEEVAAGIAPARGSHAEDEEEGESLQELLDLD